MKIQPKSLTSPSLAGWRLLLQRARGRLDEPGFWKAGGLLLLANAIVTLLGLVRTPLMTWVLPKEEMGMFGVVASWLPFLQLASLSGLDSASYHYIAQGKSWAFVVNLSHRLRWSLLSAAIFLAGGIYWAVKGETLLAWMFGLAGLSYPLTIGLSACSGTLAAQENFTSLFWYRILESLTDFSGFIPLLFSTWWISKVVTFYTANQLATATMQVGFTLWLYRGLRRQQAHNPPPDEAQDCLRYGKHLTAINAIGVVGARSDALLVSALQPLVTMADYSIAVLIQEQLKRLWNVYLTVRYPRYVRMSDPQRRRHMTLEGGAVWLVFALTAVLFALVAHLLIPVLLPPEYTSSLGIMDLLLVAVTLGIPGGMAETYFRTHQDEKRQYALRSASALFGVIAPAVLVIPWGAPGAAGGRILASLGTSLVGVALFTLDWRKSLLDRNNLDENRTPNQD